MRACRKRLDDFPDDHIVRHIAAFHHDVGGREDRVARLHQLFHHGFRVAALKQRAVAPLRYATHEHGQVRLDPDGDARAANVRARFFEHHCAPARRQHLRARGEQPGDHAALAVAKIGLAVICEYLLDGLAGRLLDLLVGIHKRQVEARRQPAPDRGFSAPGHADQHDRPRAKPVSNPAFQRVLLFASRRESHHCYLENRACCMRLNLEDSPA